MILLVNKLKTNGSKNYTAPHLATPQTQWFRAKIQSQEYVSGGVDNASKGWLAILILTFILNVLMLCYFILQPGLVTDFSQPPQLFAIAVNSPPAQAFAGSCGAGPEGKQYKVEWFIGKKEGHVYIEPGQEKGSPLLLESGHSVTSNVASGSGLTSAISTACGRIKRSLKMGIRAPTKLDSESDTEPLRPLSVIGGGPSLRSQYELGEIKTRTP